MADQWQLTAGELAGLRRLGEGKADFLDLAHACASGVAVAMLVQKGLAKESSGGIWQAWEITEAGLAALASGSISLVDLD